ncbi:hypothetical protein CIK76_05855 [Glutamicibacter sp. BW80]|nr:hypothetical protein CIK76_05855 [Glutamicibacter sp. BW80]
MLNRNVWDQPRLLKWTSVAFMQLISKRERDAAGYFPHRAHDHADELNLIGESNVPEVRKKLFEGYLDFLDA